MKNQFTQYTKDKYTIVTFNPNTIITSTKLKLNAEHWCITEKDANLFIDKVVCLEKIISNIIYEKKLPYNVELILLTYMKAIESISSGFDIRSKLSNEELALIIFEGYKKEYIKAINFCEKIIKVYNEKQKYDTYTKHWRDYDKHNELVNEYQLNYRTFKDNDFEINLSSLLNSANNFLTELINKNNE